MPIYKDLTPSGYDGISTGLLAQMIRLKGFIVRDIVACEGPLEHYCRKEVLIRLLSFSKKKSIHVVYKDLWIALCGYMIRNLDTLWCFRSRHPEEPMALHFMRAFSERYSVCYILWTSSEHSVIFMQCSESIATAAMMSAISAAVGPLIIGKSKKIYTANVVYSAVVASSGSGKTDAPKKLFNTLRKVLHMHYEK